MDFRVNDTLAEQLCRILDQEAHRHEYTCERYRIRERLGIALEKRRGSHELALSAQVDIGDSCGRSTGECCRNAILVWDLDDGPV
jgi:hypothetical protein